MNDRDIADLKQLWEILRKTLEEREPFQREVIFQAPPEMKYGELIALLDVIRKSGGMPIFPFIEGLDNDVIIGLIGAPDKFGVLSVNLPLIESWVSEESHLKNLAMVTIPKTGIYMIRGVRISSVDDAYELALASQISVAMKKLKLEAPHLLYINCDKDALYFDIQCLIKAARAHTTQIALFVKSKPGWVPMGVYRSSRRRNHRK